MKITNFFWGIFAVLISFGLLFGLYQTFLAIANGMPTTEMRVIAFIGLVIVIIFLGVMSPITNFIADDEGRV